MNSILEIRNLTCNDLIKNLDLILEPKSFNILIGSNSCGKTTLVNSILGLNKYSGEIIIKVSKEDIGIVFDKNVLIGETVIDNFLIPLTNLGLDESEAKKKIYKMSKKFQIDNLLFKSVSDLTTSQKKMVQILSSIIHDPKLVIIDDCLDDLNFLNLKILLNYLREMSKNACILMLLSNSKYLKYANNIYVMSDGKIIKTLKYSEIQNEKKLFNSINIKLPFLQDLNNKLILYKITDKNCHSLNDLVNEIWK